ncbi:MAG: hypothetical protein E7214_07880 [Clostridium sp.]|nr:hypothetical protein [Clostridium sp.]
MKKNSKSLMLLTLFISISLFTINNIYRIDKIDKDNILDTYHTKLVNSIHTINLKQFNNQDLFNTLDDLTSSNTKAIRTLKKSKFLF